MSCTLPYPRDLLRYEYFTKESSSHQAKMELRTFMWCVNEYTSEGDVILDPMAGAGTVHLARFMNRKTISIDIVPEFVELTNNNWLNMLKIYQEKQGMMLDKFAGIIEKMQYPWIPSPIYPVMFSGDSRRLLPLDNKVDAVIFSPPYGNLWTSQKQNKVMQEKNYKVGYNDSMANVGNAKNYMSYLVAMKLIYEGCYKSLVPGGVLVSVVKDYVMKGERVLCSRDNMRLMVEVGFIPEDWHYRDASQTSSPFSVAHKKKRIAEGKHRSELEIDKEDILVVRKGIE